ncbi:ABC transporter substrate-binding protein [Dactylosporangium sp. NPDC005572]|uniref:ABC transporter substrate-binding protein n=1 Tax=Dactylosporangium sp. NPDC005572 TaxID=3156889 RepID=UPI0033A82BB3
MPDRYRRRRWTAAAGLLAAATVLAGCAGSAVDTSTPKTSASDPLVVGYLVPQTGPYKATGTDLLNGFQLYLDTHGGKLGGRTAKLVVQDEAEGKQTAANAAKKLIEQDHATVLAGGATADTTLSVQDLIAQKQIPFVGTGGRPSTLAADKLPWIWHTSWLSREVGAAIAEYVKTTVDGPVFVIGPDYQGGYDNVNGFVDAYKAAGGVIANDGGKPTWTPWPATTNFVPYLSKVDPAKVKGVFTFYAGTPAVGFVQQYAQVLGGKVPLFAAGFLTDESILEAQGAAADGIHTSLPYAADLDNPANRAFSTAFTKAYNASPRLLNVTGYDAAAVIDAAAIAAGPAATPAEINAAIGKLGQIDSPRGPWRFSKDHSPVQTYYLRKVGADGRGRANILVQPLTTLGN